MVGNFYVVKETYGFEAAKIKLRICRENVELPLRSLASYAGSDFIAARAVALASSRIGRLTAYEIGANHLWVSEYVCDVKCNKKVSEIELPLDRPLATLAIRALSPSSPEEKVDTPFSRLTEEEVRYLQSVSREHR